MKIDRNVLTVLAAFASASLYAAYSGQTFDVYNEIDLTNACTQADSNNNTIRIYPGVYHVGDYAMRSDSHLALSGSGTNKRFLGMGTDPSKTVIVGKGMDSGSGLRVLYSNGAVVSNLTITGGCCTGAGGGVNGNGGYVIDCVVSNNYCTGAGGGTDLMSAYNTLYIGNATGSGNGGGGRFSSTYKSFNCTFTNNCCRGASSLGGGVSLGQHTNAKFFCNTAQGAGGVHNATVIGGTFIGNRTWGTSGSAAINGGSVTNGYFRDNISTNASSGSHSGEVSSGTAFDDCKFYDHIGKDDMFKNCSFRRCEIRTLKERGVHRDILNGCKFYNTLLVDLLHNNGTGSVGGMETGCKFYNCTVVAYTNLASKSMGTTCVAVNTIFADFNRNLPNMTLTNCLWTSGSPTTAVGGGLVTTERLRFTNAAKGDYSIQRRSVARNAGWSDAAYLSALGPVDLSGNPRVYAGDGDAVVDVGAYECCLRAPGLMMLVR